MGQFAMGIIIAISGVMGMNLDDVDWGCLATAALQGWLH